MPVADNVLRGADNELLARDQSVEGDIATGFRVIGRIVTILKGDIVVVWNTNETPARKRSGKHWRFSQKS